MTPASFSVCRFRKPRSRPRKQVRHRSAPRFASCMDSTSCSGREPRHPSRRTCRKQHLEPPSAVTRSDAQAVAAYAGSGQPSGDSENCTESVIGETDGRCALRDRQVNASMFGRGGQFASFEMSFLVRDRWSLRWLTSRVVATPGRQRGASMQRTRPFFRQEHHAHIRTFSRTPTPNAPTLGQGSTLQQDSNASQALTSALPEFRGRLKSERATSAAADSPLGFRAHGS